MYETAFRTVMGLKEAELEAAYYPSIRAFATQGHPELGRFDEYSAWCIRKIQRLYEEVPGEQSITQHILTGI